MTAVKIKTKQKQLKKQTVVHLARQGMAQRKVSKIKPDMTKSNYRDNDKQ